MGSIKLNGIMKMTEPIKNIVATKYITPMNKSIIPENIRKILGILNTIRFNSQDPA